MKYYIKNNEKLDFYLLGELSDNEFSKGHGLMMLESYPYLMDGIEFIDENWNTIPTDKFFDMVNESKKLSEKQQIEKEIKHIKQQLIMGKTGNRNHLDGWVVKGMENKLIELNTRLESL